MSQFLDLLKEKIIIFDGAMGVSLQGMNLSIDDWGGPNFENCSENLLYTRPDAVEKVHTSFLDIGCDVIETNSFGGSEVVLAEFGIADKAYDVNKKAAALAKRLAWRCPRQSNHIHRYRASLGRLSFLLSNSG